VANVYAPCDNGEKQLLWDRLSMMLHQLAGKNFRICGDFNAVRSGEKRRSLRSNSIQTDIIPFNQLIEDNLLVDLPVCGQKIHGIKGMVRR